MNCGALCFSIKLVDGRPLQHSIEVDSCTVWGWAVHVSYRTAVTGGQLRELSSSSIFKGVDGRSVQHYSSKKTVVQ